jgi:hypothetical protein
MATVVAAFIGAVVGSIGAVVIEEFYRRRREDVERREALAQRREALVRRYVFQLQDAVEALWHRVYNVRHEGGEGAMSPEYRETTTVFAVGRVLAAERVLALEGVYPQLEQLFPGLGKSLQGRRLSVALSFPSLQQYDRIALAEAVLERDKDGFRPSTFLAFQTQYSGNQPGATGWLMAARSAVSRFGQDMTKMDELLDLLGDVAHQTSDATGIPTSITEKEKQLQKRSDRTASG